MPPIVELMLYSHQTYRYCEGGGTKGLLTSSFSLPK